MQTELDQLNEAFAQFFKVEHAIAINVLPVAAPLPDEASFMAAIPEPFLLAGNMGQLNLNSLRSLQRLGELAEEWPELFAATGAQTGSADALRDPATGPTGISLHHAELWWRRFDLYLQQSAQSFNRH